MKDIGKHIEELMEKTGLDNKQLALSIREIVERLYNNLDQMTAYRNLTDQERKQIFERTCEKISSSIQSGNYLVERIQKDERYKKIISK
jgi:hypothetical protein